MKSGFQQALERAHTDVRFRIQMEEAMADALVAACLARGYCLSVNDGGEWVVKRSTDKAQIMAALFSTDEDLIMVRRVDDVTKIGWFQLIYGNDGYDVISDYSANTICDEIWDTILRPLSDKMEDGQWSPVEGNLRGLLAEAERFIAGLSGGEPEGGKVDDLLTRIRKELT
ncbi:hypothetical protein [Aquibium oceanicum]|uniref:Uncharacterized protein n=1 Tax=Aquibium oceanicum TaxID=1670800 RepID=A0A1L3SXR4_9HYPH|nr:hypothetical protein [Aquibium oceanicum]APH74134.1 hypothetical protein BSQ44_24255 [Aquibium oceanicum]